MALGKLLIPFGRVLFGWTAREKVQYIVPIGATVFIGFGCVAVFLASQSYLVDAFGLDAASATAATVVLRNVASAVVPLAGPLMFEKPGLGLGATILGLVALGFAPIPLLSMRYGHLVRAKNKRIQVPT